MAVVTDLINQSIDDKPTDFANTFNELIRDRVTQAVADKKLELSQALFGAPEVDQEEEPEVDQEEETPTEDDVEDGEEETPTDSD